VQWVISGRFSNGEALLAIGYGKELGLNPRALLLEYEVFSQFVDASLGEDMATGRQDSFKRLFFDDHQHVDMIREAVLKSIAWQRPEWTAEKIYRSARRLDVSVAQLEDLWRPSVRTPLSGFGGILPGAVLSVVQEVIAEEVDFVSELRAPDYRTWFPQSVTSRLGFKVFRVQYLHEKISQKAVEKGIEPGEFGLFYAFPTLKAVFVDETVFQAVNKRKDNDKEVVGRLITLHMTSTVPTDELSLELPVHEALRSISGFKGRTFFHATDPALGWNLRQRSKVEPILLDVPKMIWAVTRGRIVRSVRAKDKSENQQIHEAFSQTHGLPSISIQTARMRLIVKWFNDYMLFGNDASKPGDSGWDVDPRFGVRIGVHLDEPIRFDGRTLFVDASLFSLTNGQLEVVLDYVRDHMDLSDAVAIDSRYAREIMAYHEQVFHMLLAGPRPTPPASDQSASYVAQKSVASTRKRLNALRSGLIALSTRGWNTTAHLLYLRQVQELLDRPEYLRWLEIRLKPTTTPHQLAPAELEMRHLVTNLLVSEGRSFAENILVQSGVKLDGSDTVLETGGDDVWGASDKTIADNSLNTPGGDVPMILINSVDFDMGLNIVSTDRSGKKAMIFPNVWDHSTRSIHYHGRGQSGVPYSSFNPDNLERWLEPLKVTTTKTNRFLGKLIASIVRHAKLEGTSDFGVNLGFGLGRPVIVQGNTITVDASIFKLTEVEMKEVLQFGLDHTTNEEVNFGRARYNRGLVREEVRVYEDQFVELLAEAYPYRLERSISAYKKLAKEGWVTEHHLEAFEAALRMHQGPAIRRIRQEARLLAHETIGNEDKPAVDIEVRRVLRLTLRKLVQAVGDVQGARAKSSAGGENRPGIVGAMRRNRFVMPTHEEVLIIQRIFDESHKKAVAMLSRHPDFVALVRVWGWENVDPMLRFYNSLDALDEELALGDLSMILGALAGPNVLPSYKRVHELFWEASQARVWWTQFLDADTIAKIMQPLGIKDRIIFFSTTTELIRKPGSLRSPGAEWRSEFVSLLNDLARVKARNGAQLVVNNVGIAARNIQDGLLDFLVALDEFKNKEEIKRQAGSLTDVSVPAFEAMQRLKQEMFRSWGIGFVSMLITGKNNRVDKLLTARGHEIMQGVQDIESVALEQKGPLLEAVLLAREYLKISGSAEFNAQIQSILTLRLSEITDVLLRDPGPHLRLERACALYLIAIGDPHIIQVLKVSFEKSMRRAPAGQRRVSIDDVVSTLSSGVKPDGLGPWLWSLLDEDVLATTSANRRERVKSITQILAYYSTEEQTHIIQTAINDQKKLVRLLEHTSDVLEFKEYVFSRLHERWVAEQLSGYEPNDMKRILAGLPEDLIGRVLGQLSTTDDSSRRAEIIQQRGRYEDMRESRNDEIYRYDLNGYGPNYFVWLGVPLQASPKQISTSYRRLTRLYHPDVAENEKQAEEIGATFGQIQEAYEVLGDLEKRAEYFDNLRQAAELFPSEVWYHGLKSPRAWKPQVRDMRHTQSKLITSGDALFEIFLRLRTERLGFAVRRAAGEDLIGVEDEVVEEARAQIYKRLQNESDLTDSVRALTAISEKPGLEPVERELVEKAFGQMGEMPVKLASALHSLQEPQLKIAVLRALAGAVAPIDRHTAIALTRTLGDDSAQVRLEAIRMFSRRFSQLDRRAAEVVSAVIEKAAANELDSTVREEMGAFKKNLAGSRSAIRSKNLEMFFVGLGRAHRAQLRRGESRLALRQGERSTVYRVSIAGSRVEFASEDGGSAGQAELKAPASVHGARSNEQDPKVQVIAEAVRVLARDVVRRSGHAAVIQPLDDYAGESDEALRAAVQAFRRTLELVRTKNGPQVSVHFTLKGKSISLITDADHSLSAYIRKSLAPEGLAGYHVERADLPKEAVLIDEVKTDRVEDGALAEFFRKTPKMGFVPSQTDLVSGMAWIYPAGLLLLKIDLSVRDDLDELETSDPLVQGWRAFSKTAIRPDEVRDFRDNPVRALRHAREHAFKPVEMIASAVARAILSLVQTAISA